MSSQPLPSQGNNPLDLTGLEDLLDRAQLEIVTPAGPNEEVTAFEPIAQDAEPSETKLILDLLKHLVQVNELVAESGRRLNVATSRLSQLDQMLNTQNVWLERMPILEEKAVQLEEVKMQLDVAITENEWLKKSWINKFFSVIKDKT